MKISVSFQPVFAAFGFTGHSVQLREVTQAGRKAREQEHNFCLLLKFRVKKGSYDQAFGTCFCTIQCPRFRYKSSIIIYYKRSVFIQTSAEIQQPQKLRYG